MNNRILAILGLIGLVTASPVWGQICKPDRIPASTPTSRFTVNNDGTATDTMTGLIWARCAEGQQWSDVSGTCGGTAATFDWQAALQVAADKAATDPGWRLPNIKELASIVEYQCFSPAINLEIFPNAPDSPPTNWGANGTPELGYWSSTPYTLDRGAKDTVTNEFIYDKAWFLDAYEGYGFTLFKTERNFVRLVKDPVP